MDAGFSCSLWKGCRSRWVDAYSPGDVDGHLAARVVAVDREVAAEARDGPRHEPQADAGAVPERWLLAFEENRALLLGGARAVVADRELDAPTAFVSTG